MAIFKRKSNNFYFNFAPYVVSIILGVVFLIFANYFPSHKDLFIGISSTSFSIVGVFLIVETVEYLANRKLNEEIHQYINFKATQILMQILQRLCRIVCLNNMKPTKLKEFKTLGEYTKDTLSDILSNKEFLGFDIFIDWQSYLNKIEKLFDSNLIADNLNFEEAKSLIKIHRAIKTFGDILEREFENIFTLVETNIDKNIEITANSDDFHFFKYKGELVQLAKCKRTHDQYLQNKYKIVGEYSSALAQTIIEIVKIISDCPITNKEMLLDPNDIMTYKLEKNQ
ncbi:TPA: hypothetical protein KKW64_001555 [Legionella pneumophila]|nr:hypothetical protein [Legionella pneumophila]